jgi:hypothetical protein
VSTGEQADQQLLDDGLLAHNDLAHFGTQTVICIREKLQGFAIIIWHA